MHVPAELERVDAATAAEHSEAHTVLRIPLHAQRLIRGSRRVRQCDVLLHVVLVVGHGVQLHALVAGAVLDEQCEQVAVRVPLQREHCHVGSGRRGSWLLQLVEGVVRCRLLRVALLVVFRAASAHSPHYRRPRLLSWRRLLLLPLSACPHVHLPQQQLSVPQPVALEVHHLVLQAVSDLSPLGGCDEVAARPPVQQRRQADSVGGGLGRKGIGVGGGLAQARQDAQAAVLIGGVVGGYGEVLAVATPRHTHSVARLRLVPRPSHWHDLPRYHSLARFGERLVGQDVSVGCHQQQAVLGSDHSQQLVVGAERGRRDARRHLPHLRHQQRVNVQRQQQAGRGDEVHTLVLGQVRHRQYGVGGRQKGCAAVLLFVGYGWDVIEIGRGGGCGGGRSGQRQGEQHACGECVVGEEGVVGCDEVECVGGRVERRRLNGCTLRPPCRRGWVWRAGVAGSWEAADAVREQHQVLHRA